MTKSVKSRKFTRAISYAIMPQPKEGGTMALAAGTRLGPYEVRVLLGAGGMGEVYQTRDTRLDRDVAIKILPERFACDSQALNRFHREVKAVASLSHPNIVTIHDFGTDNGRC